MGFSLRVKFLHVPKFLCNVVVVVFYSSHKKLTKTVAQNNTNLLSCFHNTEVWHESHWAKIQVLEGLGSFLEVVGRNRFLAFLASGDHQHSLLWGLLPPSSKSATEQLFDPASVTTPLPLLLSSASLPLKHPCDDTVSIWII